MKKFIIGTTLGIVVGAGALVGIGQIPSVRDTLLKTDSTTSSVVDDSKVKELENKNSALTKQVNSLNSELTTAKEQITEKDNLIQSKSEEITRLTTEKEDLQKRLDNAIAENESLKELVGNDVNYVELITDLQFRLSSKTEELNLATAELEQLRVDKETLTTRVFELETRLAQVEEELANYKVLDNIETLDIKNFEGKWYVDGTFQDYYIIENGIVTHNASEDTGVIQCLNNQVYLFMNKDGSIPVNLSVDGTSFSLQDGTTYSKFYINTTETVLAKQIDVVGKYSHGEETIILNGDSTLSINDGSNTIYGSYIMTAEKKNIGGNVVVTNIISATLNLDEEQIVKTYSVVSGSGELVDSELEKVYTIFDKDNIIVLGNSNGSSVLPTSNYFKVTVKTGKFISIAPNSSIRVLVTSCYTSNHNSLKCNGFAYNSSGRMGYGNYSVVLYNTSSDFVVSNKFDFYFSNATSAYVFDIVSVGGCMDLSFENIEVVGTASILGGRLKSVYDSNNIQQTNYITCSQIDDYVNGSYVLDNANLSISSDGATLTPTDSESIVATSCSVTAKTDGYDIYQTATITYSETIDEVTTTHTLVINYKNNNVINSTLDNEEISITKE